MKDKAYYRERRNMLISQGRCITCGAKVTHGVHCEDCKRRINKKMKKLRENEAYKKKQVEQREQRKRNGICTSCGKAWAVEGKRLCEKCGEYMKAYSRKYYAEHYKSSKK